MYDPDFKVQYKLFYKIVLYQSYRILLAPLSCLLLLSEIFSGAESLKPSLRIDSENRTK
jgi:hypothetical protein